MLVLLAKRMWAAVPALTHVHPCAAAVLILTHFPPFSARYRDAAWGLLTSGSLKAEKAFAINPTSRRTQHQVGAFFDGSRHSSG